MTAAERPHPLDRLQLGWAIPDSLLDRLLERRIHFVLRGRSYRTAYHKEEITSGAEEAA